MTDLWSQHALAKAALAKGNGYGLYERERETVRPIVRSPWNPLVSVRMRFGGRR